MIAVLHGDDIGASYTRLLQLKESYKDHQKVSLVKTTPEEILQNIQSQDLLGQEKLLIVENFFAPQKNSTLNFLAKSQKMQALFSGKNPRSRRPRLTISKKLAK